MTFTAGAVDLIERYWFLKVLIPDEENSKLLGCIPIGGQHRLLQKIAQLSVSFVWTATDLQEVAVASPGTGTLLIGAFACVLQLVLMCFDVRAAWLTEKLNKEEEAKRGQRESGQIQVAHSHKTPSSAGPTAHVTILFSGWFGISILGVRIQLCPPCSFERCQPSHQRGGLLQEQLIVPPPLPPRQPNLQLLSDPTLQSQPCWSQGACTPTAIQTPPCLNLSFKAPL